MEYMCIITKDDRKCQNVSKCLLRNGTESNNTFSYILLDHSNAFGLSGGNFFVENKFTRAYLKVLILTFLLKPLNGIQGNLTGSKILTSSTKFVFFGPKSE